MRRVAHCRSITTTLCSKVRRKQLVLMMLVQPNITRTDRDAASHWLASGCCRCQSAPQLLHKSQWTRQPRGGGGGGWGLLTGEAIITAPSGNATLLTNVAGSWGQWAGYRESVQLRWGVAVWEEVWQYWGGCLRRGVVRLRNAGLKGYR